MADVVTPYQNNASANDIFTAAKGHYFRAAIVTPAAAQATLTVYDNTAQSGAIICQITAGANLGSTLSPDYRIPLTKGLSVTLVGTGASYMLYYE